MDERPIRQNSGGRLLSGTVLAVAIAVSVLVGLRVRDSANATGQSFVAMSPRQQTHGTSAKSPIVPAEETETGAQDTEAPEGSLAGQLIGAWHLKRHGKRTLTVKEDGTATADVRLNMLGALMYGEQMTLDLTWSVEGDVMTQTISSGTPEDAVNRLIRDWGGHREYRVLEVTGDKLILAEVGDEDDRQVWSRVSRPSSDEPSTAAQTKQSLR